MGNLHFTKEKCLHPDFLFVYCRVQDPVDPSLIFPSLIAIICATEVVPFPLCCGSCRRLGGFLMAILGRWGCVARVVTPSDGAVSILFQLVRADLDPCFSEQFRGTCFNVKSSPFYLLRKRQREMKRKEREGKYGISRLDIRHLVTCE